MTAGICVITIFKFAVVFPATFVALTVMLDVPVATGVPVIAPVDEFKLKPAGRVPLVFDQVIGVVPVAASL